MITILVTWIQLLSTGTQYAECHIKNESWTGQSTNIRLPSQDECGWQQISWCRFWVGRILSRLFDMIYSLYFSLKLIWFALGSITFLNIQNIHSVRDSAQKLAKLCRYEGINSSSTNNNSQFLGRLDSCNWLSHQSDLIRAVLTGVQYLNEYVIIIIAL